MLKLIQENWVMIVTILGSYACFLKVQWDINEMKKKICEDKENFDKRIHELKLEYNNDLDEIKSDLKENVKLSHNINVSLVSLTSFLHGKGFIPPECKD